MNKEYYCIIDKKITLTEAREIIDKDMDDNNQFGIHWTQTLDVWDTLDAAQRAIARYSNGNTKRIIKYTETLEEIE